MEFCNNSDIKTLKEKLKSSFFENNAEILSKELEKLSLLDFSLQRQIINDQSLIPKKKNKEYESKEGVCLLVACCSVNVEEEYLRRLLKHPATDVDVMSCGLTALTQNTALSAIQHGIYHCFNGALNSKNFSLETRKAYEEQDEKKWNYCNHNVNKNENLQIEYEEYIKKCRQKVKSKFCMMVLAGAKLPQIKLESQLEFASSFVEIQDESEFDDQSSLRPEAIANTQIEDPKVFVLKNEQTSRCDIFFDKGETLEQILQIPPETRKKIWKSGATNIEEYIKHKECKEFIASLAKTTNVTSNANSIKEDHRLKKQSTCNRKRKLGDPECAKKHARLDVVPDSKIKVSTDDLVKNIENPSYHHCI